jgi:uncharacterized membrane protein
MIAAYVPAPWPLPGTAGSSPWRFGQELPLDADSASARTVLHWLIRRNCSITPGQLAAFYLSLCCISLGISAVFLWQGAPLVMAFATVELLLVGVALLVFARHAGDRETLTLDGRVLRVEQQVGPHRKATEFSAEWVAVEPAGGQGSLVAISGEGRSVQVGRFLRPELRQAFARELRLALRRAVS